MDDVHMLIRCADCPIFNLSLSSIKEFFYLDYQVSPIHALGHVQEDLQRLTLPLSLAPLHNHTGPFGSNTSTSILLLNNELDPVCPLQNAERLRVLFPGSRLLIQETAGHGVVTDPSTGECIFKLVSEYMNKGTVPEKPVMCRLVCEVFAKNCS
ncbi:hypothetical protein M501DRAFT_1004451 [Patellaria atrata CBS 101060]|uniref:Peptidase S33 tripeptidyl aminopeptidase-like C-terminal domain-containing protein n=1 Tax=Patellaria atrata CBS 101060 TaxID=1346257 RepID=A0A9P4VRA8_9PEZI|nr:hypothetical protein M501DRAFT_1004451 [Patellaria atrata CBS 101060]